MKNQNRVYSRRSVLLCCLLLAVLGFSSISNVVVTAQEGYEEVAVDVDTREETMQEEVQEEVPAEVVEERVVEEVVAEVVQEVIVEPVAEVVPPKIEKMEVDERPSSIREAASEPTKASSSPTSPSIKTAFCNTIDSTKSKMTALVKRVKAMDQNDAKKVAAATLGVWGVSVGVGWLANAVKK